MQKIEWISLACLLPRSFGCSKQYEGSSANPWSPLLLCRNRVHAETDTPLMDRALSSSPTSAQRSQSQVGRRSPETGGQLPGPQAGPTSRRPHSHMATGCCPPSNRRHRAGLPGRGEGPTPCSRDHRKPIPQGPWVCVSCTIAEGRHQKRKRTSVNELCFDWRQWTTGFLIILSPSLPPSLLVTVKFKRDTQQLLQIIMPAQGAVLTDTWTFAWNTGKLLQSLWNKTLADRL